MSSIMRWRSALEGFVGVVMGYSWVRVNPTTPRMCSDAHADHQVTINPRPPLDWPPLSAGSYANKIVPEARGEAEQILQGARAYKEQTVAEATGQTARFLQVYEEYKKAPEVTRKRMYLETMERVLGGSDKIIIDSKNGQGVVPFLSLDQLQKRKEEAK
jgi:membrane protease subunit HflK